MNISDFDPMQFRQALGTFTTGVTIVTTCGAQADKRYLRR